jgi:hypothetical protein
VDAILALSAFALDRQESICGGKRNGTFIWEKLRAKGSIENHMPGTLRSEFCNFEITEESESHEEATEAERLAINRKLSEPLLHPKSFPNKTICEEVEALPCSTLVVEDE